MADNAVACGDGASAGQDGENADSLFGRLGHDVVFGGADEDQDPESPACNLIVAAEVANDDDARCEKETLDAQPETSGAPTADELISDEADRVLVTCVIITKEQHVSAYLCGSRRE